MAGRAMAVGAVVVLAACGSAKHGATSTTVVQTPVAPQARAPGHGVVYFQAGPDGDHLALYSLAADGTGLTPARARPFGMGPFSPDGSRMAFEGRDGVYTVLVGSGGDAVRLTRTRRDIPLAWSPDGNSLLVARIAGDASGEAEPADLYAVAATGATAVRINPPGTVIGVHGPRPPAAWSPDGARVVFAANEGSAYSAGSTNVYVASADGRAVNTLAGTENGLWPSWSPDGQWIAYDSGPHHELFIVHPDGSGGRQLTNGGNGPFSVAGVWSPDSQHLLFVRGANDDFAHNDLWTVRTDGTDLRQLTHRPQQYDDYAWLAGSA